MSKLDNIILQYGNAVLDLPKTNDPIGKPVDEAKQQIKDLMRLTYNEALLLWINKEATSLDGAFERKVQEL